MKPNQTHEYPNEGVRPYNGNGPAKIAGLGLLLGLLAGLAACKPQSEKPPVAEKDALVMAKKAMGTIMPKMIGQVGKIAGDPKKGFVGALRYCNTNASDLMKQEKAVLETKFKQEYGIQGVKFGRSSLRFRNPANKPDKATKKVLLAWHEAEKAGQKAAPRTETGKKSTRAYLPIRIPNALCLNCHGKANELAGGVPAALKKLYPADKATGYSVGDLRGVFVAEFY